jgi:hypothetical protein
MMNPARDFRRHAMKRTALASLFSFALAAGAAQAQVVGGGVATISGGGDDMVVTYSAGGAGGGSTVHSQSGRLARFTGNSDGMQVEYPTPAPAEAGREAWLVGGGDNAEVVYDRRR